MLLAQDAGHCGAFPEILTATIGDLADLSSAAVKTLRQVAQDSHSVIEAAGATDLAKQWQELWEPWGGYPSTRRAGDVLPPIAMEEVCRLTTALRELIVRVTPWAQTGAVFNYYAKFGGIMERMRARREGRLTGGGSAVLGWLVALAALGAAGYGAWRYRAKLFPTATR